MAVDTFQTYAIITLAGISAAIDAGGSGPAIEISGYRLGSRSAAEGALALETDVDVDDFVYAGTTDDMQYTKIDDDTVCWTINLGVNTGNFDIGQIGIMIGTTLFGKAVLPGKSNKYKSNLPAVIGNRKTFKIIMTLTNLPNVVNVTVMESTTASLPEVATELDLPPALSTPYNAWLVRNHTHIGRSVIATRLNGDWKYSPYHDNPNQGIGILATSPVMYDASCTTPSAVYYDPEGSKFWPADGGGRPAVGIRTEVHELTRTGMIPGAIFPYLPGTLTPGTRYYVGIGVDVGKLTTTPNGAVIAIAISTVDLWVNASGSLDSTNPLDLMFWYGQL